MKQMLKLSVLPLFLLLSVPYHLTAQSISHGTISGTVFDEETQKPLFYANIFIANTTLGTASDKNGKFRIDNIPLGNYQLIISMMGYELKKIDISIRYSKQQNIRIGLQHRAIQGKAITISAYRPSSWQKNYRVFKELLLGKSPFSDQCRLLNTEVLDIKYNRITHTLNVGTKEPLHIENNALGYDIYLTIEEFSYQGVGFFKFKGIPHFIEKRPKGKKQRSIWKKNRIKAYNGSLRHFLTCLANNTTEEQGFKIYPVKHISRRPNFTRLKKYNPPVPPDSITFKVKSIFERELFFKNYLKVEYLREPESERYTPYKKKKTFQTSWILINSNQPVIFTVYGSLYNPYQIKTYGYWAWEGFAEALPYNYIPDPINNIQYLKPISVSLNEINAPDKPSGINETDSTVSALYLFKKSINAVLSGDIEYGTALFYKGLSMPGSSEIFDSLYIPSSSLGKTIYSQIKRTNNDADILLTWKKLDPTPATLTNEAYCELVNRISTVSKIIGKSAVSDERKIVYLKFGKPYFCIQNNISELIPDNECWIYKRDTTEIIFDFIKSDTSYRLLRNVNTLISPSDVNYVEKLMDFIQPRTTISRLYENFIVSISKDLQLSQDHLNTEKDIYKSLSDQLFDKFSDLYKLILVRQKKLPFFSIKREAEPIAGIFDFFNLPADSNFLINSYVGIPCSQLGVLQTDTIQASYLRVNYTIFDKKWNIIRRRKFYARIKYTDCSMPFNSIVTFSISDSLPYGEYKIAFQVQDTITNKVWYVNTQDILTGFPNNKNDLFLSKIIPVYQVSTQEFTFYPSKKLSRSFPIHFMVYFCNLQKNNYGLCNYKLSWELKKDKSAILRKPYEIRGEIIEESNNNKTRKIIEIDLSKIVPGFYTLIVNLEDQNSNKEQKTMLRIHIYN